MTSNISGKFVILDTEDEFLKNFSTAICKEINYRVNYKLNTLLQKSKQIVREILEACAFNIDVANGKLDADLGLRPSEGKSKMDAIIQMLVDEIDIQFRNFRFQSGRIEGGIDIFILEETYKNILASGHAIIITDNFDVLDWLRWFLLEGNKIIIFGYHLQVGTFNAGRSGKGLMFKNGTWKVQTQYAGTQDDNFLTREMDSNILLMQDRIGEVFQEALE